MSNKKDKDSISKKNKVEEPKIHKKPQHKAPSNDPKSQQIERVIEAERDKK